MAATLRADRVGRLSILRPYRAGRRAACFCELHSSARVLPRPLVDAHFSFTAPLWR
jgi:hypothetical protein